MTAREKADERLGAALDRIAARLAEPFTARDVTGDLGIGEAFERDYGIDQSGARGAARVDHADLRQAMLAPPRTQRSAERRVGQECVSPCSTRGSPYPIQNTSTKSN